MTIVTLLLAPAAIVDRAQVRVEAASEQPAESDTYTSPDGNVSVRETPAAPPGPLLETVTVYVNWLPASTGSGLSDLLTDKSAWELTVVVAVALSFVAFVSPLLELMVAVFEIVPGVVVGFTPTTRVKSAVVAFGNDSVLQVTVPVWSIGGVVHAHPGGAEMDLNIVLAGSTSLSAKSVASNVALLFWTLIE
jgi:hypothetical protein